MMRMERGGNILCKIVTRTEASPVLFNNQHRADVCIWLVVWLNWNDTTFFKYSSPECYT